MSTGRFRAALIAGLLGAAAVTSVAPAAAHQPITLDATSATASRSPIIVDGSVSFAVTARFGKAGQVRHFRFVLGEGRQLKADYLILDKLPERKLRTAQLPQVTITTPTGQSVRLTVDERTPFYEPYGGKHYFFLSRIARTAEPGVYLVKIVSRAKSEMLVAVGEREVRGDVLNVGTLAGSCPVRLASEPEIPAARARQLIGMRERTASACAVVNGWGFRVGERDGEQFAVTMDYSPQRVTVAVQSDRVTAVTVG